VTWPTHVRLSICSIVTRCYNSISVPNAHNIVALHRPLVHTPSKIKWHICDTELNNTKPNNRSGDWTNTVGITMWRMARISDCGRLEIKAIDYQCCCLWPRSLALRCPRGQIVESLALALALSKSLWPWPNRSLALQDLWFIRLIIPLQC